MVRFFRFMLATLALPTVMVLLAPVTLLAFSQPSLAISAGNITGADYAASSAMAKVFNRKATDYGMRIATASSLGAVADVDNVVEGKTAFGIAQSVVLQRAAQGLGPWKGKAQKGLRAVLGLHVEIVTLVAAADRGIREVHDLKGMRVNIGAPGSTDYQYGATLLGLSGVNPEGVTLLEHPVALASELLQKDEIDAYLYTVGHPNLSVLEASTGKRKVLLIPLDKNLIEQVIARDSLLIAAEVPTNFYPDLENRGAVPTIGVRAVLFTRADMAEETVYRLVKEVMTNFDLFRRQHPVLEGLTPREAASVKVIPVHPGAARFFREAGLAP